MQASLLSDFKSGMFNRLLQVALLLFALVIIHYLAFELIMSEQGYLAYQEEKQQLHRMQQEIVKIQAHVDSLAKEIIYIRDNPHALEALIHSELGYVYPDEYVLIMEEQHKKTIIKP